VNADADHSGRVRPAIVDAPQNRIKTERPRRRLEKEGPPVLNGEVLLFARPLSAIIMINAPSRRSLGHHQFVKGAVLKILSFSGVFLLSPIH